MTSEDPTRARITRRAYPAARDARAGRRAEPARTAESALGGLQPPRIVLTGGPGSGKSTAAAFLAREFASEIWVLPEAATLLYRGGLPRGEQERGVTIAQRAIFDVQRSLEDANAVLHADRSQLCDRGTVDGAAYWPAGADAFFAAMGSSHARELARYDAVIFLHTAALLPGGYERDLEIRTEDQALAVELDERVFALYESHPRLVSITSQGSFLDKLVVVRAAVRDLITPAAGVDVKTDASRCTPALLV